MGDPIAWITTPEKPGETKPPEYSDIEKAYFQRVTLRMCAARDLLQEHHDEFDGMTYSEVCEANRKLANTHIEPKKTKSDNNFSAGTVRQKIFTYLAAVANMDLNADVSAFDEENREIRELGEAMEDILFEIGERDGEGGDLEKKILRQYTMLEQGGVAVRETFSIVWKVKKILQGVFTGKLDSVKWTRRLIKSYEGCTRQILLNENIIPGNIRQYGMEKQPFFVDIDVMPYVEAEQIYKKWDRWENVPRELTNLLMSDRDAGRLYSPFKFYTSRKDMVEVARYQDVFGNDMQIFINGVMMLPVQSETDGFPMLTETYDIAWQVNEVISPHFFFGKSMCMRLRNNALLYDEMIRMALKKTQKSFAPPLLNLSGRQLSQKIFAPGSITSGIKENSIALLDPNPNPVNPSEVEMIQMLQNKLDEKSVNPVFSGQQGTGTQTATQVLEVQKQAKMMIGLTILVFQLLEYKLAWLRLQSVIKNWFQVKQRTYNQYAESFMNRYRSIVHEKYLEGVGKGKHIIRVTDQMPTLEEQQDETNSISTQENPVKITYLDPEFVTSSKLMWMINIVPRERKSDALSKVLFNEFVTGAMQFPGVNAQYLSERYAEIWDENPAKVFPSQAQAPQQPTPATGQPAPGVATPQVPTPNNAKSKLLAVAAQGS